MIALVAGAGPAAAAPTTKTVEVSVDFYDPGVAGASNPFAKCALEPDAPCTGGFDGVATMAGTWTGSTRYTARATPTTDAVTGDVTFEVWETFTGTADGCGRGTFQWHLVGVASFTRADAVTQTVPFSFRLWVIDGSGTAGLTGITGSAAGEGHFSPLLEQTGHFTGRVTCGASVDVAESDEGRAAHLLPRTG